MADLTELARQTYADFSGGLNEDVSPHDVQDNEVIAAQNVQFSSFGSIQTRLGETQYRYLNALPVNALGIVQPVRGMHRYVNSDGTRAFAISSGTQFSLVDRTGVIYIDDDTGTFTEKTTLLTNDGFTRFEQYKNALFMGTDRFGQRAIYAKQTGDDIWFNPSWAVGVGSTPFIGTSTVGTNSFQEYTNYFYRYTYDIYIGGTFLFETGPVLQRTNFRGTFAPKYLQDVFSPTDATTVFNFTKYGSWLLQTVAKFDETLGGATIKRINIYRRQGRLNESILNTALLQFSDFFFIGSVDAVDFDAADQGSGATDILFVDDGIAAGAATAHGGLIWPPYARFMKFHKNRMWLANTTVIPNEKSVGPYTDANLEVEQSRIYYSEMGRRGANLLHYQPFGFTDINPSDGEPITGLATTRDGVLLVFKPNKIYAIRGGDTFIGDTTKPAIRVTTVSNAVGCIAPETIVEMEEGVVFLSHLGVYITNGNSTPVPIDLNKVQNKINETVSSRKYFACAGYDEKEKEIWVAFTHPDSGGQFNRTVNVFSKKSRNWTRYDFTGTSSTQGGIGMFSNKKSLHEHAQFFFGREDNVSAALAPGPVGIRNSSFRDRGGHAIEWSFQTKFYDMGTPEMNKDFQFILFHVKSISDLTLHILCDNRIDTRTDAGGGFTIQQPSSGDNLLWNDGLNTTAPTPHTPDAGDTVWDTNTWGDNREGLSLVRLDDRIWGHRISIIVSGSNRGEIQKIDSFTPYYKPKEEVRF